MLKPCQRDESVSSRRQCLHIRFGVALESRFCCASLESIVVPCSRMFCRYVRNIIVNVSAKTMLTVKPGKCLGNGLCAKVLYRIYVWRADHLSIIVLKYHAL